MTKNQHGFAHVVLPLFVAAITAAVGAGYYVWHRHLAIKTSVQTYVSSSNVMARKPKQTTQFGPARAMLTQTYANPQYKFSFQYPASWKLNSNLQDLGRGGLEGDIYVQSLDGTQVHFGPNFGGKGGDCWDDAANARTTRTCTTRNILSIKKLVNAGVQDIWLIEASNTAPLDQGGKTKYSIYLSSRTYDDKGNLVPPSVGSQLGAFLGVYDDVSLSKAELTIYVSGPDDSQNGSKAFLNSPEIREAIPVLESFKVNQ